MKQNDLSKKSWTKNTAKEKESFEAQTKIKLSVLIKSFIEIGKIKWKYHTDIILIDL